MLEVMHLYAEKLLCDPADLLVTEIISLMLESFKEGYNLKAFQAYPNKYI